MGLEEGRGGLLATDESAWVGLWSVVWKLTYGGGSRRRF